MPFCIVYFTQFLDVMFITRQKGQIGQNGQNGFVSKKKFVSKTPLVCCEKSDITDKTDTTRQGNQFHNMKRGTPNQVPADSHQSHLFRHNKHQNKFNFATTTQKKDPPLLILQRPYMCSLPFYIFGGCLVVWCCRSLTCENVLF